MKIIFMGTSRFALPSLSRLIESPHEIIMVVTQPDKQKGRGKKLMASPVKELALENRLPLFQPARIKDEDAAGRIVSLAPDLIVVVSYGQIIPKAILDTPVYGCINIHASLLPMYRGAAPIQRAIMAGEEITGVTAMLMDEGLDTGDIIGQMTVKIGPAMNHGELEQRLALVGADLLAETLLLLESGTLPRKKQDEARSTYADMIKPKDEIIDWNKEVAAINNQIRALSPSPGAYTTYAGIRFKIFGGRIVDKESTGVPGQITGISSGGLLVQTGCGTLEVIEVQREGKKRMNCSEFLAGFKLSAGNVLGS